MLDDHLGYLIRRFQVWVFQDFIKQMASIDMLSYLGGTVSMLAATFIVFSALSMGVAERQRTLAMLRAVGLTDEDFARNPIGVEFEPDQLLARLRSGEPEGLLKKRPEGPVSPIR